MINNNRKLTSADNRGERNSWQSIDKGWCESRIDRFTQSKLTWIQGYIFNAYHSTFVNMSFSKIIIMFIFLLLNFTVFFIITY